MFCFEPLSCNVLCFMTQAKQSIEMALFPSLIHNILVGKLNNLGPRAVLSRTSFIFPVIWWSVLHGVLWLSLLRAASWAQACPR